MVKEWQKACVPETASVKDAMLAIDVTSLRCALVTNETYHLQGFLTDGDIRRFVLAGGNIEAPVTSVMNAKPLTASADEKLSAIRDRMVREQILHLPVVDEAGRVVNVCLLEDFAVDALDHAVVIMAGGLGKRLSPMTDTCPKPLLKVGGKPILETIIDNLTEFGLRNIYLSVNYRAEMIAEYFGDGEKFGVNITYLHENEPLGTAGALSLIETDVTQPLVVMNGDLLTKVNIKHLLDYHFHAGCDATMCVREHKHTVPYGVIEIDGCKVKMVSEKPDYKHFINAGMYVLNPGVLRLLEQGQYMDMPDLFQKVIAQGGDVSAFPIREYWLDIGQKQEFKQASEDFEQLFSQESESLK